MSEYTSSDVKSLRALVKIQKWMVKIEGEQRRVESLLRDIERNNRGLLQETDIFNYPFPFPFKAQPFGENLD